MTAPNTSETGASTAVPFALPLRKGFRDDEVVDSGAELTIFIGGPRRLEQQKYVIRAVNSHEKLLAALEKYGNHEEGCRKLEPEYCYEQGGHVCTCGFDAAKAGQQ